MLTHENEQQFVINGR